MTKNRDPIDQELQNAIRDLPDPVPDPSYRERTRKMFLESSRLPREQPRRAAFRAWAWAGGALATAAVLAVVLWSLPGRAAWQMLDPAPPGSLTINGVEVPAAELSGAHLHPGTRIRGPSRGEVVLAVPGALSLVLGPDTEITVGSSKGFLGSPALSAVIHQGTAWGTTGPDFPTAGLDIQTDHADIHVTGTTFAVLSGSDSTCVCVLTGSVDVTAKHTGERRQVSPEHQLLVPRGGLPLRLESMSSSQLDRLETIRKLGVSPRK